MPNRLRWPVKLGYGAAELGVVAVETLLQIYLLKFYNITVGLPAQWTGLALALALVWDAVSDPLMGGLSDRTRSRWGRRRPYLLPGALGLAIGFAVLFDPPTLESNFFKFLFLLVSYLFVSTAMTVVTVPHLALGAEISFDRDERTEVFGYRRLFATLGSVLGLLLPAIVLIALGGEETEGATERSRRLAAWLLVGPILASTALTLWATRGLDRTDGPDATRARVTLGELLREQLGVLRNPVFVPLLAAFVVAAIGRTLNASTALYYYEFRLGLTEQQTITAVLLPFFAFFVLSIPMWVVVSRRFGKRWPALVGVGGLGVLTAWVYLIFPAGRLEGPVGMAILGGVLAGAIVLLDSMVADVVDHDELRSGRSREGLYFGVWKMGTKLSRALGLLIAGLLLGWIGFDETGAAQTPEVARRLAWLFGPVVGVFFLAGGAVLACAPLTDAHHRRVQALLVRRRAQRTNLPRARSNARCQASRDGGPKLPK